MRSPTTPILLTALLLAALPFAAVAWQDDDDAFLRVTVLADGEDRIHRLPKVDALIAGWQLESELLQLDSFHCTGYPRWCERTSLEPLINHA